MSPARAAATKFFLDVQFDYPELPSQRSVYENGSVARYNDLTLRYRLDGGFIAPLSAAAGVMTRQILPNLPMMPAPLHGTPEPMCLVVQTQTKTISWRQPGAGRITGSVSWELANVLLENEALPASDALFLADCSQHFQLNGELHLAP